MLQGEPHEIRLRSEGTEANTVNDRVRLVIIVGPVIRS